MRPLDRRAGLARQFGGGADVIDMAVREQDLFDRRAGFGERGLDARQVAAGVHDRRAIGFRADDDRAILFERGDGHDCELEGRHEDPSGWTARIASGMRAVTTKGAPTLAARRAMSM